MGFSDLEKTRLFKVFARLGLKYGIKILDLVRSTFRATLGAHTKERASPILSLGPGILTERFIFRLRFPAKKPISSLIRFFDFTYDCLEQCTFN